MWRGPPLAEFASLPFAAAEIARLEEQRLAAIELRMEANLGGRAPRRARPRARGGSRPSIRGASACTAS